MKNVITLLAAILFTFTRTVAAQNPIEAELFPPDFLFAQREALGLSETQLQDLQSIVQEIQPKFETLKGQLEQRVKVFQEALQQPKPDVAQTEEKLKTMLAQENEMKILQVHLMLTLRNKLTPEQVEKARRLRPQSAATGDANAGLPQRLQAKFEKLKSAVEALAASGQPPEDIVAKAHEIQQLVQSGKPQEAEHQLDALLASLPAAKAKP